MTSMTGLDNFHQFSQTCFRVSFCVQFFQLSVLLASVADGNLAVAKKSEASAQCRQVRAQQVVVSVKIAASYYLHLHLSALLPLDFLFL